MSTTTDDESQQNFILAFLFGLIALVLFLVIGVAMHRQGSKAVAPAAPAAKVVEIAPPSDPEPPQTTVSVVTETVTAVVPDGASVRVQGGTVNFYFATGSADLAPGAAEALATVIKGVEDGRKALVAGFHDTTGDAAVNERLARQRAQTVRDVLAGLGVPAGSIDIRRPAIAAGSGNDAEARRVEVKLID